MPATPAPRSAPTPLDPRGAAALQAAAEQAVPLLRALANPERLVLLCELAGGERSVGDLAEATGVLQPTLSQQLGVLREMGLVSTRREGRFVHYQVASAPALALLGVLHAHFCAPRRKRGAAAGATKTTKPRITS